MELKELKEKIEYIDYPEGYNFICDGIPCNQCPFLNHLDNNCEGKRVDYNWGKIKELDLSDNTVVTKELLKEFKN